MTLLQRTRAALSPGSIVVIRKDWLNPADPAQSPDAELFSLRTLLANQVGDVVTLAQIQTWLAAAATDLCDVQAQLLQGHHHLHRFLDRNYPTKLRLIHAAVGACDRHIARLNLTNQRALLTRACPSPASLTSGTRDSPVSPPAQIPYPSTFSTAPTFTQRGLEFVLRPRPGLGCQPLESWAEAGRDDIFSPASVATTCFRRDPQLTLPLFSTRCFKR